MGVRVGEIMNRQKQIYLRKNLGLILKYNLNNSVLRVSTELGTTGRFSWNYQLTLGFHKRRENYWHDVQEEIYSVNYLISQSTGTQHKRQDVAHRRIFAKIQERVLTVCWRKGNSTCVSSYAPVKPADTVVNWSNSCLYTCILLSSGCAGCVYVCLAVLLCSAMWSTKYLKRLQMRQAFRVLFMQRKFWSCCGEIKETISTA